MEEASRMWWMCREKVGAKIERRLLMVSKEPQGMNHRNREGKLKYALEK